jgi:putative IMPACT (imprinted ancient) family translation regulator
MEKKKNTARKAIDSYIKHEDIVDNAVKLGQQYDLDVESTDGNNKKGDIKVAKKDSEAFLNLLGTTIDKNQAKGDS